MWSWNNTETRALLSLVDLKLDSLSPYIQFPRTVIYILVPLFSLLIIVLALAVHIDQLAPKPRPKAIWLINIWLWIFGCLPALSTNNCISEDTQTSTTHHLCLSRQLCNQYSYASTIYLSAWQRLARVGLMVKINGDASCTRVVNFGYYYVLCYYVPLHAASAVAGRRGHPYAWTTTHRRSRETWRSTPLGPTWPDLTWPVRETRNATERHGSWDSSCGVGVTQGPSGRALASVVPNPELRFHIMVCTGRLRSAVASCSPQCRHGLWVWEFPGSWRRGARGCIYTCSRSWGFLDGRRRRRRRPELSRIGGWASVKPYYVRACFRRSVSIGIERCCSRVASRVYIFFSVTFI